MKYNSYFFKIFRIVFVNIFLSTGFFIICSIDIPGIMVEVVAREFNNDLNLDCCANVTMMYLYCLETVMLFSFPK